MRAMLEEELARKQREMATSTKNSNIMLKQESKDKGRQDLANLHKAEDDDYMHQTNVRIRDPYQNPLV